LIKLCILQVNHEEDSQQQSFSLLELDCGVHMSDTPTLSIVWKDANTFNDNQVSSINMPEPSRVSLQ